MTPIGAIVDPVDVALGKTRLLLAQAETGLQEIRRSAEAAVRFYRAGNLDACRDELRVMGEQSRAVCGNGRLAIDLTEALLGAEPK